MAVSIDANPVVEVGKLRGLSNPVEALQWGRTTRFELGTMCEVWSTSGAFYAY